MFNLQCALGLHPWAKWGDPYEVEVTAKPTPVSLDGWTYTTTEPNTWREIWQARMCSRCSALQNREVRKVRP